MFAKFHQSNQISTRDLYISCRESIPTWSAERNTKDRRSRRRRKNRAHVCTTAEFSLPPHTLGFLPWLFTCCPAWRMNVYLLPINVPSSLMFKWMTRQIWDLKFNKCHKMSPDLLSVPVNLLLTRHLALAPCWYHESSHSVANPVLHCLLLVQQIEI